MKGLPIIALILLCLLTIGCSVQNDDPSAINDHFYVRTDGADLPVQVQGDLSSKIMLIMLHGGPGGDALTYNDALPEFSNPLEAEFAMVYYDQRSSGSSSGKFKKSEFLSISQHVLDLRRLILALEERYGNDMDIFLMGHSWGGTLGTAFLLTPGYQDLVKGWIEVDGAHNFSGVDAIRRNFETVGQNMIDNGLSTEFWNEVIDFSQNMDVSNSIDISKLNSYGYQAEVVVGQDGFLTGVDNSAAYAQMKYFSKYDATAVKTNLFFTSSGFGMFDEVISTDYTARLVEITTPTLLMWGKYDFVLPLELGREAFETLGTPLDQKALWVFETSGHSPMVNQPIEFSGILIDWIKEVR